MTFKLKFLIFLPAVYLLSMSTIYAGVDQVPGAAIDFQVPEGDNIFNDAKYKQALNLQKEIIKNQTALILKLRSRIDDLEARVSAIEKASGR